MRIIKIGEPKIIMSNHFSAHNYFGWPTAARLKNGRIAVAASGLRLAHICPFGKVVMSFSDDEGETYTAPAVVIDTTRDDRDAGLATFGESGLLLTSFTLNDRDWNAFKTPVKESETAAYCRAYVNMVEQSGTDYGCHATFRISRDNGLTFGPICQSPVTSPHGPIELRDGRILWVGNAMENAEKIQAYFIHPDGKAEYRGQIDPVRKGGRTLEYCEPYVIETPDGTLICHIRVQDEERPSGETTYQSESVDCGQTWSTPHELLPNGGAPAHLMYHSSGVLISSYGYRVWPDGARVMLSTDHGQTWDTDHVIYQSPADKFHPETGNYGDLGYASTVELSDGSLLTVFYAHPSDKEPAVIMQQRWHLETE